MNHVLSVAALVQFRHDAEGRAYYRRKRAAGKAPMGDLRCLKRRLSDVVYCQLIADAKHAQPRDGTDPGGHCGATLQSSAVDSHRSSTLRISHFPDPQIGRYADH